MKKLLIVAFMLVGSLSITQAHSTFNTEIISSYSDEEICTTGWHSDGTWADICYVVDYYGDIVEISIAYNGSWYYGGLFYDRNGRRYTKNRANKRYYF